MKQRTNRIGKTVRGAFWIIVMVAVIVILLALLNWIPSLIHEDFVQKYDSIRETARSLGHDYKILVPTYFPEGISWPPSLILAQKKPYKAVVIEFSESESMKTFLILIQSSLQKSDLKLQRITMTDVTEKTEYSLKGTAALLTVGTCDTGINCSSITWNENAHHFTVLIMSSPFELIKVAESMIH
jgi:hypothetical protein